MFLFVHRPCHVETLPRRTAPRLNAVAGDLCHISMSATKVCQGTPRMLEVRVPGHERAAPGLELSQATHANLRDPATLAASNARPRAAPLPPPPLPGSKGSARPEGPELPCTARGSVAIREKHGAARTRRSRDTSSQRAAEPKSRVPGDPALQSTGVKLSCHYVLSEQDVADARYKMCFMQR